MSKPHSVINNNLSKQGSIYYINESFDSSSSGVLDVSTIESDLLTVCTDVSTIESDLLTVCTDSATIESDLLTVCTDSTATMLDSTGVVDYLVENHSDGFSISKYYELISSYENKYGYSSEKLLKKWKNNLLDIRNEEINDWLSTYLQLRNYINTNEKE